MGLRSHSEFLSLATKTDRCLVNKSFTHSLPTTYEMKANDSWDSHIRKVP